MMGKLQRRIWRQFLVKPPGTLLSTTELLRVAYPRQRAGFRNWHWYSVRMAARKVAIRVRRSSTGRGRPWL